MGQQSKQKLSDFTFSNHFSLQIQQNPEDFPRPAKRHSLSSSAGVSESRSGGVFSSQPAIETSQDFWKISKTPGTPPHGGVQEALSLVGPSPNRQVLSD